MKTNKQQQQKAKQKTNKLEKQLTESENKITKYTKPEQLICFRLLERP
jgi:phage shock protein A